jgi:protein O-mannosyl-transferase
MRKASYSLAACCALITLAVYLPALANGFVWDDDLYIQDNIHLRSLGWTFVARAFSSFYASNWHPLALISHALDYSVWGLNPLGHHLTNIVLHALNTFLVVLLCVKLLALGRERSFAGVTGPSSSADDRRIMITAGVTALLFGLHPLHVESVAWAAERKDLLCGLFFLLSVSAYASHVIASGNRPVTERNAVSAFFGKFYLLSLGSFIFALMSKPMAVSLPLVLLVLDWHPFQRIRSLRSFWAVFAEKLPYVAVSLAASALTIMAQRSVIDQMSFVPLPARLLVAARTLVSYLMNMAAPAGLSPYYPYPKLQDVSFFSYHYFFPVLAVVGVTAALFISAKGRTARSAWLYYLATLAPVIGIIQVGPQSMADRYTYLPSLGPFLIMGLAASRAWEKAETSGDRGPAAKVLLCVAAAGLLFFLSLATVKQISLWNNNIDFWSYVIETKQYRDPIAYNNRGQAFEEAGQTERALADFNAAIALAPDYDLAYGNRALVMKKRGQLDRALQDFDRAVAFGPGHAGAYAARGILFEEMGQLDSALSDFTTAIALDRDRFDAYLVRGKVFQATGRSDRAIEDFTAAIALAPDSAEAYTYRGIVLKEMGQFERAVADYSRAIDLEPSGAAAYNNRGAAYKHLNRLDLAISDYTRAIALDPSFSLAYCNRGIVYGMAGRYSEAMDDYTRAISLKPDLVKAYLDRGDLYLRRGEKALANFDYQKACDLGSEAGCEAAGRHRKKPA